MSFEGSELVWQHYAGQGIQIQVLGTAGKLNALAKSRRQATRTGRLLDELLPLAAERAGGLAWEYYFPFGGGEAPWASGLAQGHDAPGARARRAPDRAPGGGLPGHQPRARALRAAAAGRRARARGGRRALPASTPSRRGCGCSTAFVQSLVGLYDYACLAATTAARGRCSRAGEQRARAEVPTYDTGAWSLYSRVSITRESDLGYHTLVRDFLRSLCDRTAQPVYCDTAQRFTDYLGIPPESSFTTRRLRGGTYSRLRLDLSKISALSLRIERARRARALALRRDAGARARSLGWAVPRRPGDYTVTLTARDLAGNPATVEGIVEVLKPRKRGRGT